MNFPCRSLLAALSLCSGLSVLAQAPVLNVSSSYAANMSSVKVAELNNDNAPEMIGLDNTSNAVVVLKNTGTGSYGAPQYYAISGGATGLDVGDFNGDGYLDVAVSFGAYNASSGKVAVLRGNGDGTLQLPKYFTVPIPANSIAVADYNNDNRPDIAVIGSTNNNGTNKVAILTNTGTTTSALSFSVMSFTAPVYFSQQVGPNSDYVSGITHGDFNGDGREDLAYFDNCTDTCGPAPQDEVVMLANTTGGWVAKTPAVGGTGDTKITAADLDGDGITDLIIPYIGCHTPCVGVEVYYMKNDFSVASTLSLDSGDPQEGPFPYQVVAGDFNNDGKTDIAGYSTGGYDQNFNLLPMGIMMWTGVGTRTFSSLKYYNQPNPPNSWQTLYTAAGFLDKNGTRDLVVPKGLKAQVWKNSTSTSSDPCSYPSTPGVHVCKPGSSVVAGKVQFVASGRTNVQPMTRMELWVDGKKVAQRFSDRLKVTVTLAAGTHTVGFDAVGANGVPINKKITVTAH